MSYRIRWMSLLSVCATLLCFTVPGARAQLQPVLLTVNVANPTHVVITTTGALPQTNNNTTIPLEGILLTDLFTADLEMGFNTASLIGNLAATGSVRFEVGYSGTNQSNKKNINLFTESLSPGTDVPMTFSTTTPAFVGGSILDLSTFPAASFQAPGFVGDVRVGQTTTSPVLGAYLVIVPEPSSATVLGVALFCRRRRV